MENLVYIMNKAWSILSYDLIITPFRLPFWAFALFPIMCAFLMKLIFKRRKL